MSLSKSVCGFFRGTSWDSQSFFHRLNPCWVLQPEVIGTYLPGIGTLGWGTWCGAGTPGSQDIPPEFLSTTNRCELSPLHVSTPLTSLDECGFFNSVVVRVLFNLVSDGSKRWLFYILVVVLIWLCKEASCVYLCCHLRWKSLRF